MIRTGMAMTVALVTLLALTIGTAAQGPEVAFRAAVETETVKGDLKGAIEQYRKIVDGQDRSLAAQALIRMAQCYEKLGAADAYAVYQRVIREFPDQKAAVETARARLGAERAATPRVRTTHIREGEPWSAASPDGASVTYTDWTTGDLGVRDVKTGVDRRLTHSSAGANGDYAEEAVFSPDGTQVVYSWFKLNKGGSPNIWAENGSRYELRLVSASGASNPRTLYDNEDVRWITPRDWSPDGQWIAVALNRKDRTTQIGVISPHGGAPRVLKTVGEWRDVGKLFFSRDGRYLAFDAPSDDRSHHDVFVLSVDGASETVAVSHPSHDVVVGWAAGNRLLFASNRTGSWAVYAMPFSAGKVTGRPDIVAAGLAEFAPIRTTAAGALFYAVESGGVSDISIADVDLMEGELRSTRTVPELMGGNTDPAWSPDGKLLAHVQRRMSAQAQARSITIRSTDSGKVVRELRPALKYFNNPRWTPDAKALTVNGTAFNGKEGLYRLDLATEQTSLVAAGANIAGAWSSDTTKFYYTANANQRSVVIERDVVTGVDKEIVRSALPLSAVRVSADGQKLYYREGPPFASLQPGQQSSFVERVLASGVERRIIDRRLGGLNLSPNEDWIATITSNLDAQTRSILIVSVATGESREVMRDDERSQLTVVAWAPDSRSVLGRKITATGNEIWWVPLDGRQSRKLLEYAANRSSGFTLALHPNGRQLAVSAVPEARNRWDIWVMENFLSAATVPK